MELKFYEAILHTGNRTEENIRKQAAEEHWIGSLEEKDIQNYIDLGKYFDGCQVAVADALGGEGYALGFWNEKDDAKIKEAFYLMEQDDYFGCFVGDREGFDAAWKSGEYEPGGTTHFSKEEVEVIGPLGKGWSEI